MKSGPNLKIFPKFVKNGKGPLVVDIPSQSFRLYWGQALLQNGVSGFGDLYLQNAETHDEQADQASRIPARGPGIIELLGKHEKTFLIP